MRIGRQAGGDYRKDGRIHSLDFERTAGRKRRQNPVYLRLRLKHGRDHVFAPGKVNGNFRRAPTGCRSYVTHTGDGADGFLYRCGYFHRHLLRWAITGIERNADARKTDLRKKRDRQGKTYSCAGQRERSEQEQNGTRMAVRPRGEVHFLISTAMPSSNS